MKRLMTFAEFVTLIGVTFTELLPLKEIASNFNNNNNNNNNKHLYGARSTEEFSNAPYNLNIL